MLSFSVGIKTISDSYSLYWDVAKQWTHLCIQCLDTFMKIKNNKHAIP